MHLRTKRLVLRPYRQQDAPVLVELLGVREVAETTLRVPHPYTMEDAQAFLARAAEEPVGTRFAACLLDTGKLVGGVGLMLEQRHHRAELGYWIGHPYWGNGYATEAAAEALRYGFEDLKLNRICAGVFGGNEASIRVLQKLGMQHEGTAREHFYRDKYHDDVMYAILARDWRPRARQAG